VEEETKQLRLALGRWQVERDKAREESRTGIKEEATMSP
jgi:hypothetical protein